MIVFRSAPNAPAVPLLLPRDPDVLHLRGRIHHGYRERAERTEHDAEGDVQVEEIVTIRIRCGQRDFAGWRLERHEPLVQAPDVTTDQRVEHGGLPAFNGSV